MAVAGIGKLGNLVWEDRNGNGIQDAGEVGVSNISVSLYGYNADTSGWDVFETTKTDSNGLYTFTNFAEGDRVKIRFVLDAASNYVFTKNDGKAIEVSNNSDVIDANGYTKELTIDSTKATVVQVDAGTELQHYYVDAGLLKRSTVSSKVWNDLNSDGIQDAGESGMSGVTVRLVDNAGNVVKNSAGNPITTTTDASGNYTLSGIAPGSYKLQFVAPNGYAFSPKDNPNTSDLLDSDANNTGITDLFSLTSGVTLNSVSAGMYTGDFASVGNKVWVDANGNGKQDDANAAAASGVTVNLYTAIGNTLFATTKTNANGDYNFANIPAGSYRLQFVAPNGYIFTLPDRATDNLDSDVDKQGYTPAFTLAPKQYNGDMDAGLFSKTPGPLATLGDYVWRDTNANGKQDETGTGLDGVEVKLFTAGGSYLAKTVTAGGGKYLFDELMTGDYRVYFNAPEGYKFTTQKATGTTDANDSDAGRDGYTAAISVNANGSYLNVDAGMVTKTTADLGDYVWRDKNANGIQDEVGMGMANIPVRLYTDTGTFVRQMMTDSTGYYLFRDVAPGNYKVRFSIPDGYLATDQGNGSADTDSDINANGETAVFSLVAGQEKFDVDAGLVKAASVGDRTWYDVNADGQQDSTESVLTYYGWTAILNVKLFTETGTTPIAETQTDKDGYYHFNNLKPGNYKVQFDRGAFVNLRFTEKDLHYDDRDSDADQATGMTDVFTLKEGEVNNTIDAGYHLETSDTAVALGGITWHDINGNGLQEDDETAAPGVPVYLFNDQGTYLNQAATSDANGVYYFLNLPIGSYKVQFALPNTLVAFTKPNVSPIEGIDSDADPVTGFTAARTVNVIGEYDGSFDAGLYLKGSIGDKVWNDANRNGIQDAGEAGLGGVTVELYNSAGAKVKDTLSANGTGAYTFGDLAPDTYKVKFVAPASYIFSKQDVVIVGVNTEPSDSDANVTTGYTAPIPLFYPNHINTDIDAGLYAHNPKAGSIGDYVWHDINANGKQDTGEKGIAGVVVNLYTDTGSLVATQTTDANGLYQFTEVTAGKYKVFFTQPTGYLPTDKGTVATDGTDSNVGTDGYTSVFTLAENENNDTIDAGYYRPATIGDLVWLDSDKDGRWVVGEVGVPSIPVTLYTSADVKVAGPINTDANGLYSFTGLKPGAYKVKFDAPADMVFTGKDLYTDSIDSDADPATGMTGVYNLKDNEINNSIDAGVYRPYTKNAKLGDRVWLDRDGDGEQDMSGGVFTEPGLAGVTVELYEAGKNRVLDSTVTAADGSYSFTRAAGNYEVRFTAPSGYAFSPANAKNDAVDSDADVTTGRTGSYTLAEGETNNTIDAGLYIPASLGDYVWNDKNGNGAQGNDEPGINGVVVKLLTKDGIFVAETTTKTVAGVDGKYQFTGLVPGDYKVQFITPEGYALSKADATNDNLDSDANPATGMTAVIKLASGDNNLSVDAGMSQSGSIGDRVWLDKDGDGIQKLAANSDEVGFANVEVKLWQSVSGSWQLAQSTKTDADGKYLFNNLAAGDYRVEFVSPKGYCLTWQDKGTDDNIDSDANMTTGMTATYSLNAGQNIDTVDAGMVPAGSIGNWVWGDHTSVHPVPNGIQDSEETGCGGVTIHLLDANDQLVGTTSSESGYYSFDNLPAGSYRIYVPQQTNFFAPHDIGGNVGGYDAIDSDIQWSILAWGYDGYSAANDVGITPDQRYLIPWDAGSKYSSWVHLKPGQIYNDLDFGLTPLVVDLNGDGVKTIARSASDATFDLLGNGHAIRSGWISGEDGFLAIDNNGDGKINDISELFGGLNKGDGFAKLASFDSNHDGVVDANDARFTELKIWRDANGDHVSEPSELVAASQLLASLNVDFVEVPELDENGNVHLERSSVVLADGSSVAMHDVYFNVAASDVAAANVNLPNMADLLSGNGNLDGLLGGATTTETVSTIVDTSSMDSLKQLSHLYEQQLLLAA